jgi:starch synthase
MAKPIQVLFLSAEVEPFAKTGGLADVSNALPLAVYNLAHEMRIMLPRYASIKGSPSKLHDMIRLQNIPVPVGEKVYHANVKSSFLLGTFTKVQVYLIDNQELFGRPGIYVDPTSKKPYPDNDVRYIFFCRSMFEMLKRMGWKPEIIHCNDWHAALACAMLKTIYKNDPFYAETKSVMTIHNMAYQGDFPKSTFAKTGLPPEVEAEITHDGKINFLKAGLLYADAITAVSERYAEEIRTTEYGYGLQDVIEKRKRVVLGITNGVDYNVWNPAVDELIHQKYDLKNLEFKVDNKQELCARMRLPFNERTPLIGMISRLADQKGFDILSQVIGDVMKLDVQMVLLGIGDKKIQTVFERVAKKYPKKFAAAFRFDTPLAHLIEAGSDMFLMPSRYEPCGLNQLYSMKYGTVPIVRATGGLDETVEQIDDAKATGTGFKFAKYDGKELLKTIQRAVKLYENQDKWMKIVRTCMSQDFSWEGSAKQYVALYKKLLGK